MSKTKVVPVEPTGLLKLPKPYYACEECLEHRSEMCCRPADELVVCGGRLLCEDCCDYAPDADRDNARPFASYIAAPTPEQYRSDDFAHPMYDTLPEQSEVERLREAALAAADTLEKEWSTWVQLQELAANLRAALEQTK